MQILSCIISYFKLYNKLHKILDFVGYMQLMATFKELLATCLEHGTLGTSHNTFNENIKVNNSNIKIII